MIEQKELLLDTCLIYFTSDGTKLRTEALLAIEEANLDGRVYVSPISAWEIGQSMARGRLKSPYTAIEYFDQFVKRADCSVCDLTAAMLANASSLPNLDHRDPVDCILIATARASNYTLVTRDRAILDYGSQGYVRVLAC